MTLRRTADSVILGALLALMGLAGESRAEKYSLGFSSASNRMSWTPSFPGWSFAIPVTLAATDDTTSMLRVSTSASLGSSLNRRNGRNTWQDRASLRANVDYPILGPKGSIGFNASMSARSSTLVRQKIRNQTFGLRFSYRPFARTKSRFSSLRASITPGVITASRASRVNLDSTIVEKGIRYNASLSVSPKFDLMGERLGGSLRMSKNDNTLKTSKSQGESLGLSTSYKLLSQVQTSISFSESRSQSGLTRAVITEEAVDGDVERDTTVAAELSKSFGRGVSTKVSFDVAGFDIKSSQSWRETKTQNTANADQDPRNRFFARDRKSDRWEFDLSASGKLPAGLVVSSASAYEFSDERRLPVELEDGNIFRDPTDDREDRGLSVSGSVSWPFIEDHSLTMRGSARSNRDDSPAAPEQDRDTISRNASLNYRGRFDNDLSLSASLSSSNTHRVNLNATRSGDNSRSSDLRLAINTSYERFEADISHAFDISARRTIFDFDRQLNISVLDRRSNIRRGWSMRHTVRRSLLERIKINANFRYSADDFGVLLVSNNAQIVEEDNADFSLGTGMSYRPTTSLTIGMTYSYRLDRQWTLNYTEQGVERDLERRSPHRNLSTNVDYRPTGSTNVSARASRSRQRSGDFDSFSVSISRQV